MSDGCHWPNSPINPAGGNVKSGWFVGTYQVAGGTASGQNVYGWDAVGWNAAAVNTIRTQGPQNGNVLPCTSKVTQNMSLLCNNGSKVQYKTNALEYGVGATTVFSKRDGVGPATEQWP